MKIENWKRVIHTKEETTWQNQLNTNIIVQVIDMGNRVDINLYNAKNNTFKFIGKEFRKNRAIDKAIDFMRIYK